MDQICQELKLRMNVIVANAQKVHPDGWMNLLVHPLPRNNTRDHSGVIQVFSGHNEGHGVKGNELLPRLVYIS